MIKNNNKCCILDICYYICKSGYLWPISILNGKRQQDTFFCQTTKQENVDMDLKSNDTDKRVKLISRMELNHHLKERYGRDQLLHQETYEVLEKQTQDYLDNLLRESVKISEQKQSITVSPAYIHNAEKKVRKAKGKPWARMGKAISAGASALTGLSSFATWLGDKIWPPQESTLVLGIVFAVAFLATIVFAVLDKDKN